MRTIIMATVMLPASSAFAGDLAGGQAPQGTRLHGLGGSGVAVGYQGIAGPDGGLSSATVRARLAVESVHLFAEVPFAMIRAGSGTDADVGHIALTGFYDLPYAGFNQAIGLRTHFGIGENAWGWLNRPDEFWPGAGLDALWQGHVVDGGVDVVVQGSLGIHTSGEYAPFPRSWLRGGVSTVIDGDIGNRFGATGELTLQYWDTTPIELAGLARVDLVEGLRLRAGALLPIATWAGWTPTMRPSGVREVTILADLSMAL